MDLGLTGKVALVTGVSRGIGWATAARLLQEGAAVVGMSRSVPDAPLDGLHHVQAEVRDDGAPERLVDVARSQLGRVDIVVNNAGAGPLRTGYEAVSDQEWKAAWELLFLAAVRTTNAALPSLRQAGGGVIVNVSSRNGRVPVAPAADYSAAKASLNNYSKGLAGQLAPEGIRVVTVSPGPTATAMWLGPDGAAAQRAALTGVDPASVIAARESRMPHGRLAAAGEVADLIVYLASARAGSISGVDILIDAGLTETL